jgi:hypothetical protein
MKGNRILNTFNLLRELDYLRGTILSQLHDDLREFFDKEKEKKTGNKHPKPVAQQELFS